VTGGAGFIGSSIVHRLAALGHEARVVDNLVTGCLENLDGRFGDVVLYQGSILDMELLRKAFAGADYVLHQGAIPSVPRSLQDPGASNAANVDGMPNVLLAARDAGVKRVVDASSSSVYGEQSCDFTFVDDVIAANLQASEAPGAAGAVVDPGCGGRRTLDELIELIQDLTGRNVAPEYAPPRPSDVRHSQADISRARDLIGYAPKVSFEEGVRRTLDWC
jgi:nucleoside-diphosphate-sugar epimerase